MYSRRGTIFALITLIVCQLVDQAAAARRVDAQRRARTTMRRRRAQGQLQERDQMPLDVPELFQLTKGESLKEVEEVEDAFGEKVERLQETYYGLKVYDTVVTIHKDKDGRLTGEASGEFIQNIAEDLTDTEETISKEEVLNIALKEEGDNIADVQGIKYEKEIYLDKENKARLVNIVSYVIKGLKRPIYIIDVKKGEVLKHWQALTTYPCCERNYNAAGGNKRTGKIMYGDMPYCLSPNITDGKCYLENEYVRVMDNDDYCSRAAYFDCETGPIDTANGAYSPAVDAFFYGTVVGKMFEEWFHSTALKNKIVLRVHYGYNLENAFWDGECCLFGDGADTFYPFTSLDIVAHEIGHGVTEFSSGLEYYGESGGINEAFSDIMGEAAEDYLLKSDFMTGHTIMKNDLYLREFERPENDGMSISHVDDMYSYTDVHYSSGIYRRIWYVVVKEEGMPLRDAFTVFLHANKMYWHETSSFFDASCGLLRATLDCGYDLTPFQKAFKVVGIRQCEGILDAPALYANKTKYGVVVSNDRKPRFIMHLHRGGSNFFVDVQRNSSRDVLITVMTGGWNMTDGGEIVAEDVNNCLIPAIANNTLYIQLSLSSSRVTSEDDCNDGSTDDDVVEVAITAGYSVPNSTTEDNDNDDYDEYNYNDTYVEYYEYYDPYYYDDY